MRSIYLDDNATTPIDPAVRAAILPFLGDEFGNPGSAHAYGRPAAAAVAAARVAVAALIAARPDEIVFTGSGSEANNLAIKGVVLDHLRRGARPHVVTCAVEHPAVLEACRAVEAYGASVTVVPVDATGRAELDRITAALTPATALVSLMHSNNEVGTLQPVRAVAALCRPRGILVHTDAAQSLSKLPVRVDDLGVDLLTVVGHKLYAPKGVGALYVRKGLRLEPLVHGGGQECGRRAGTESVALIAGLGAACGIAAASLPDATVRLQALRDRLHRRLTGALGERLTLNGHPAERLPNTLNVNFPVASGVAFLARVPGVAASTGSACHSGQARLSPVLAAMGVPPAVGRGAVRLSVGRFTTEDEVDRAADLLAQAAV
jgi:cysteine desulfurase